MPKRIQRKNFFDWTWKKNPNAIYVGRPSKWGNPFDVKTYGLDESLRLYEEWLKKKLAEDPKFLEPLRGKDLVCFCPLDQKCHADILLRFLEKTLENKMVEEFDVIDTVFRAIELKTYKKYSQLLKVLPEGLHIEWSLDKPYAKAEKSMKGVRITKTCATGGFLLRAPSKSLIVMFPMVIMLRNDIDEEDIDKIRCVLDHDFIHELIHYLAPNLSETWVETANHVLSMEECVNLDCKYLTGSSMYCDQSFLYSSEIEDPEEIPIVWDAEWERYYEKLRKKMRSMNRRRKKIKA